MYPTLTASEKCKGCGCDLPINPAYQYCIDCRCEDNF